ncbi:MAG: sugar-binding transcriptional regulator [Clostridium sp.]|jgi:DNA-binding transcriptional regulator LsrR (DeoR family)|uniref:sugar-binding transcriptional regulator n=1 Tax=Clostridium sp. TaxID=1506 RepID=UPI0025C1C073|nr:sugar-binding transcriptional regulator [Clostridium sp.]MCH3963488.1 sugar-binding transcriptional regulator [Clostridium sp.]MCI1714629.1 sugar-binding transcriptional regulator [Clostridium sp.]MCI1799182.1 sugar-binding transcriptional regulator [Clostridium sp.]MCI1812812.1 sugar-binding transcriptional regulator [Clostridium sp.]MCI1869702.1 sugar-binding transcriptional regulator [Clostridium sp.]
MQNDKLIAKIAYLYYMENKTQEEISKELNVYRTTISRLLKQAKKNGIVHIEIKNFDPQIIKLERIFKKMFKLKEVIIVESPAEATTIEKNNLLAVEAANFIKKCIKDNMTVGLAWGSTIGNMVEKLEKRKLHNVTFIPLAGGPSQIKSKYHVNTLVYEMSRHFNGNSIFINGAVIEENKQTKDAIVNSRYFDKIKSSWNNLDIAIVGIGGGLNSRSQWRDLLNEDDIEDLKLREVVGDCCGRFFDIDGNLIKNEIDERTIGLPIEQLSEIPTSIAIARSKNKARAILPFIKRQYINTLITDEETAKEILKRAKF